MTGPLTSSLTFTLILLAIEVGVFVFCLLRARRPIDPLRPRLINYNLILILLAVVIMATLAHIVSLISGQQLMPRRSKGMR